MPIVKEGKPKFHILMKSRFRRNNIVGLKKLGTIVGDVARVKHLVVKHFQDRFQVKFPNRTLLE